MASDDETFDETDRNRSLSALVAATQKFEKRICASLKDREVVWHRLMVKVDRGKVSAIQLISDEQMQILVEPNDPEVQEHGRDSV